MWLVVGGPGHLAQERPGGRWGKRDPPLGKVGQWLTRDLVPPANREGGVADLACADLSPEKGLDLIAGRDEARCEVGLGGPCGDKDLSQGSEGIHAGLHFGSRGRGEVN